MKNILIIGATGQIGSELTMLLRKNYSGNVVAGYIPGAPKESLIKMRICPSLYNPLKSCPFTVTFSK